MDEDGVVTHDEVLRWLPAAVQRQWAEAEREREMALPPEQRGWATAAEVENLTGEWIEVLELGGREPFYLPGRR
jgi:hypothetical protein